MSDTGLSWLRQQRNSSLIQRGLRGVEKEGLRVRANGQLSRGDHPVTFGAALTHPYLTTDYSEALLEFVTPPYESNWETLQFLCDIHSFVHAALDEELLWPASMPCIVNPNKEIPIARYGRSNEGMMRTVYRRGLGYRYGRAMQAIAGAHFNYSLPQKFWPAYREALGASQPLREFQSAQLMSMVRNYRRYAWLVIYLFGSSPAFCKSFRPEGDDLLAELNASTWYAPFATSLRMSDMGYRNKTQARLNISSNSLQDYVDGLQTAMSTTEPNYESIGIKVNGEYRQLNANILQIENEYYSSIRPKPGAKNRRPTLALQGDGVEYVEVRSLDLNANDPVGLNQAQMRFLESLLIYCLLVESPPIDPSEQSAIDARDLSVAREGRRPGLKLPCTRSESTVADWGAEILDGVAEISAALDQGDDQGYVAALESARAAVLDPERTPSAELLRELRRSGDSFFDYALALAHGHHDYFLSLPLEPNKQQFFSAAATQSIDSASLLEADSSVSFEGYLRQYFA